MKLYIALELSNKKWKLGFGDGARVRIRTIDAGDLPAFQEEVALALKKWQLAESTKLYSVYEAGRDGFWVHRWLESLGVANVVVDPASIAVNRRRRRVKTDRVDVRMLLKHLQRYHSGELKVWSVLRVPGEAEEDQRRREREIKRIKKEIGAGGTRIKSLLALHGIRLNSLRGLDKQLEQVRCWDGRALPAQVRAEILRAYARLELARGQLKELERLRAHRLAAPQTYAEGQAQKLFGLRGIGPVGAMTLCEEFFGWRQFANVREVGAAAGLTGTPYCSGDGGCDQGISKAGNPRVRALMIELAWSWLRYQPESDLSRWFLTRFNSSKRSRRIGIVALARKLLVALWKYLVHDQLPEGAWRKGQKRARPPMLSAA